MRVDTMPVSLSRTACVVILMVTSLAAVGCGALSGDTSDDGNSGELTVAAAADLQFAFAEIGDLYTERTGQQVTFSFGSTGNLATQIGNGAPFDVYAAANVAFVDDLIADGHLVADTRVFYAVGRIVLAVNRDSGVRAQTLGDLLDPSIQQVTIANPEHAPYGMAAKQALENAGLWEQLESKLVYGENVRQTLQFVQSGNADAGIVALSIADVPGIDYVMIDEDLHEPLLQAMAVVSRSEQQEAAREFIELVMSDEGLAILDRYGFVAPEAER